MIACDMDTTRVCHPLREPFARLGSGLSFSVELELSACDNVFFWSRFAWLVGNLDKTKGDITYWTAFHRKKDATTVGKWDARWGSPRKLAMLELAVYRPSLKEETCIPTNGYKISFYEREMLTRSGSRWLVFSQPASYICTADMNGQLCFTLAVMVNLRSEL
jgi:hypothetical protein